MSGTTILPTSACPVRAPQPHAPEPGPAAVSQPARPRRLARLRTALPQGIPMTAESFRLRHRVLRLVLATHLPALMALGVFGGHGASRVLIELAPAAVMLMSASTFGKPGPGAARDGRPAVVLVPRPHAFWRFR